MLQETWMSGNLLLNGFNSYSLGAIPGVGRGRCKGGLGVLVATALCVSTRALPSYKHYAMAIIIQFTQGELLIINVYLPPQKKKSQTKMLWTELENYITTLLQSHPNAFMVLGGDLNARLGPDDYTLYTQQKVHYHPPTPGLDDLLLKRKSKDPKSNYAGLLLKQMTIRLNLHILNGAFGNDHPAELTYLSGLRMSQIDYLVISTNSIPLIEDIEVSPKLWSDHLPVSLSMKAPCPQIRNTKFYKPELSPEGGTYCRIKWSLEKDSELRNLYATDCMQTFKKLLIHSAETSNLVVTFQKLTYVLKQHLNAKTRSSSQWHYLTSKGWFDRDCVTAKKTLHNTYKLYKSNPGPKMAHDLLTQKNLYKQLLRQKKKNALKESWTGLIQAAKLKNSALFWKLVKISPSCEPTSLDHYIHPGIWEQYLYDLYKDPNAVYKDLNLVGVPPWSPVTVTEIHELAAQMKSGKAPGGDLIPSETIKNNLEFWGPVLASLFSFIDKTGQIPDDWGLAIIVPIYKKGNREDPANYRPISLLSNISKLYSRHLHRKLKDWLEQEGILAEEQAGFREGRTTIDQCFVLQHLIEKYISNKVTSLYAAYIDLKAAFDSISRVKLWEKLEASNIDRRLLFLIQALHRNTTLKVRCSIQGHLTNPVTTQKGVKQGCILAPLLFNFYINTLVDHLSSTDVHPPRIAGRHVSILLYADDAAILSRTPIGLRRALWKLTTYCEENQLTINYKKTKVMAFARRPKLRTWMINQHRIEQVSYFKYLGVVVHSNGSRRAHGEYVALNAQKSSSAIIQYMKTKGGHYLPAALRLFQAKTLAQLLYGSQLGPPPNIMILERIQSKFLRAILEVPRDISNVKLRLESGQTKIEAKFWIAILSYWLKLCYLPAGLAPLVLQDTYKSSWIHQIEQKIAAVGLSVTTLLGMGYERARATIKQLILDIERQNDVSNVSELYVREDLKYIVNAPSYFTQLENHNHRRAFTLARLRGLPSAVSEGRYKKIPWNQRLCPCGSEEVETTEHVLLYCPYYRNIRATLITPLLIQFPGRSQQQYMNLLLSDTNPDVTSKVARYLASAMCVRKLTLKVD